MTAHAEVARRTSYSPAARQHRRDLTALDREGQRAERRVEVVGDTTQRALRAQAFIELTCEQAMQIAPGGAARYNLLAAQGAVALASVIDDVVRRTR